MAKRVQEFAIGQYWTIPRLTLSGRRGSSIPYFRRLHATLEALLARVYRSSSMAKKSYRSPRTVVTIKPLRAEKCHRVAPPAQWPCPRRSNPRALFYPGIQSGI